MTEEPDGLPMCNVCNENQSIGVACVPGLPLSVAYCRECLSAGVYPKWALLAGVDANGGAEHCAGWYLDMRLNDNGEVMSLREYVECTGYTPRSSES